MVNMWLRKFYLPIFIVFITGIIIFNNSLVIAEQAAGVKVMEKAEIGKYLTDAEGMTLYRFTKDEKSVSNCKGDCLTKWPPFYVDPSAVVEGCEASDFASITKEDGSQQTTYKGVPLYYFMNDKNAGDTNGQGFKDVWFVVSP